VAFASLAAARHVPSQRLFCFGAVEILYFSPSGCLFSLQPKLNAGWPQSASHAVNRQPATLAGWRHSLDKWLLPLIGETRLADVGNATLKTVTEK